MEKASHLIEFQQKVVDTLNQATNDLDIAFTEGWNPIVPPMPMTFGQVQFLKSGTTEMMTIRHPTSWYYMLYRWRTDEKSNGED